MQVFYWVGPGSNRDGKIHYQAFALNGVNYKVGDSVYLYPEDEHYPHYIGRIVTAFVDEQSGHADPHCIQVKWYERRVNLETHTRGIEESEREVFELEDTDVNPIGCISGKNCIVRARNYEEAYQRMRGVQTDWYFCRGYFLQQSNSFQPYTSAELAINDGSQPEEVPEMEEPEPPRQSYQRPPAPKRKTSAGRACEECGITNTPQWREGPNGPRTLCNACGLRYCRQNQKQQKRGGGGGRGSRGGGRGGGYSAPRHYVRKSRKEVDDIDLDEEEEEEEEEEEAYDDDEEPMPRREPRPLRQSAKAALARTALFAQTGAFPVEQGELMAKGEFGDMDGQGVPHAKKPRMAQDAVSLPAGGIQMDPPAFNGSAQLPIAALDLPGSDPAAAMPGGPPVKLEAAAVNLLALSSVASKDQSDAAKVLDNAANMGSPRLLAATHLGSPKAGAQLLHPTSTSAPDGPAASGSQLPGIHASDIASILGMNLTPTAGAAGSALRGSLVGLPTGGSTGGLGGPQTSFDPSSLVAPILTKPGSSPANGGAAAQGAGEPAAAGPAPLSAPGSALLRGGGVPGASPLGHGAGPSGLGSLLPMSQPGSATTTSAWAALQSPLAMLGGPDLGLPQGGASGTPLLDNDFLTNSFRTTEPDMPALEQMFATLDSLPAGALPPDAASKLADVRDKVEAARKEAAAAEAAVSAVSQVYLARQEAAEKARETAAKAGDRLKQYLMTLMAQHGGSAAVDPDVAGLATGTGPANGGVGDQAVVEQAVVADS